MTTLLLRVRSLEPQVERDQDQDDFEDLQGYYDYLCTCAKRGRGEDEDEEERNAKKRREKEQDSESEGDENPLDLLSGLNQQSLEEEEDDGAREGNQEVEEEEKEEEGSEDLELPRVPFQELVRHGVLPVARSDAVTARDEGEKLRKARAGEDSDDDDSAPRGKKRSSTKEDDDVLQNLRQRLGEKAVIGAKKHLESTAVLKLSEADKRLRSARPLTFERLRDGLVQVPRHRSATETGFSESSTPEQTLLFHAISEELKGVRVPEDPRQVAQTTAPEDLMRVSAYSEVLRQVKARADAKATLQREALQRHSLREFEDENGLPVVPETDEQEFEVIAAEAISTFYPMRKAFYGGTEEDEEGSRVLLLPVDRKRVEGEEGDLLDSVRSGERYEALRNKTWSLLKTRFDEASALGSYSNPSELYDDRIELWLMLYDAVKTLGSVFGYDVEEAKRLVFEGSGEEEGLSRYWCSRCHTSLEAWRELEAISYSEGLVSRLKRRASSLESLVASLYKEGLSRSPLEGVAEGDPQEDNPKLYVRPFGVLDRHFARDGSALKESLAEAPTPEQAESIVASEYAKHPRLWEVVCGVANVIGVLPARDPARFADGEDAPLVSLFPLPVEYVFVQTLRLCALFYRSYSQETLAMKESAARGLSSRDLEQDEHLRKLPKDGQTVRLSTRSPQKFPYAFKGLFLEDEQSVALTSETGKQLALMKREVVMNLFFGEVSITKKAKNDVVVKRSWERIDETEADKELEGTLFEAYREARAFWLPGILHDLDDLSGVLYQATDAAENGLLSEIYREAVYKNARFSPGSEGDGTGVPTAVYSAPDDLQSDDIAIKLRNPSTDRTTHPSIEKVYSLCNSSVREGIANFMFDAFLDVKFSKVEAFFRWSESRNERGGAQKPAERFANLLVGYMMETRSIPLLPKQWLFFAGRKIGNNANTILLSRQEVSNDWIHIVRSTRLFALIDEAVLSNEFLVETARRAKADLGINLVDLVSIKSLARSDVVQRNVNRTLDRVASGMSLFSMGYTPAISSVATEYYRAEKLGKLVVLVEYAKDLKTDSMEALQILARKLVGVLKHRAKAQQRARTSETTQAEFSAYARYLGSIAEDFESTKKFARIMYLAQEGKALPENPREKKALISENAGVWLKEIVSELVSHASNRDLSLRDLRLENIALYKRLPAKEKAKILEDAESSMLSLSEGGDVSSLREDERSVRKAFVDTKNEVINSMRRVESDWFPTYDKIDNFVFDLVPGSSWKTPEIHGKVDASIQVFGLAYHFVTYGTYPFGREVIEPFEPEVLSAFVTYARLLAYSRYLHPSESRSDGGVMIASLEFDPVRSREPAFVDFKAMVVGRKLSNVRTEEQRKKTLNEIDDAFAKAFYSDPLVRAISALLSISTGRFFNVLFLTPLDVRVLGALLLQLDYWNHSENSFAASTETLKNNLFEDLKKAVLLSESPSSGALEPPVDSVLGDEDAASDYIDDFYKKSTAPGEGVPLALDVVRVGTPLVAAKRIVEAMRNERILPVPEQISLELQLWALIFHVLDTKKFSFENRRVLFNRLLRPAIEGILSQGFDVYVRGVRLLTEREEVRVEDEEEEGEETTTSLRKSTAEAKGEEAPKAEKPKGRSRSKPSVSQKGSEREALQEKFRGVFKFDATFFDVEPEAGDLKPEDENEEEGDVYVGVLRGARWIVGAMITRASSSKPLLDSYSSDKDNDAPLKRFSNLYNAMDKNDKVVVRLDVRKLYAILKTSLSAEEDSPKDVKGTLKRFVAARPFDEGPVDKFVVGDLRSLAEQRVAKGEESGKVLEALFSRLSFWLQLLSSSLNERVFLSFKKRKQPFALRTNLLLACPVRSFASLTANAIESIRKGDLEPIALEKGLQFTIDNKTWPKQPEVVTLAKANVFGAVMTQDGEFFGLRAPEASGWSPVFLDAEAYAKKEAERKVKGRTSGKETKAEEGTKPPAKLSITVIPEDEVDEDDTAPMVTGGKNPRDKSWELRTRERGSKRMTHLFRILRKGAEIDWKTVWNDLLKRRGCRTISLDRRGVFVASVLERDAFLDVFAAIGEASPPHPAFINDPEDPAFLEGMKDMHEKSGASPDTLDAVRYSTQPGEFLVIPSSPVSDYFAFLGRTFGVAPHLQALSYLTWTLHANLERPDAKVLQDMRLLYNACVDGGVDAKKVHLWDAKHRLVAREANPRDKLLEFRLSSYAKGIVDGDLRFQAFGFIEGTLEDRLRCSAHGGDDRVFLLDASPL